MNLIVFSALIKSEVFNSIFFCLGSRLHTSPSLSASFSSFTVFGILLYLVVIKTGSLYHIHFSCLQFFLFSFSSPFSSIFICFFLLFRCFQDSALYGGDIGWFSSSHPFFALPVFSFSLFLFHSTWGSVPYLLAEFSLLFFTFYSLLIFHSISLISSPSYFCFYPTLCTTNSLVTSTEVTRVPLILL